MKEKIKLKGEIFTPLNQVMRVELVHLAPID